ncbi:MAG: alpha/beta fold hydrolase [Chromatiales bacterium]|nr:MAG: alpha/beta fold hydrolase [Chromatiales bacterium]
MTRSDNQDREAVVLVHGLWMHGLVMEPMRWRLEQQHGYAVHAYSYPSVVEGLDANVDRLLAFLRGIRAPRVHLVGHSMGGVLVLRALARVPDAVQGRVVCLGAPLAGSGAAQALKRLRGGEAMLGKLIRESLLQDPMTTYEGPRDVGVIAGDGGFGIGAMLNALESDALRPPHDGTVTVDETRLPGIRDHIVLSVTHTWMLVSPEVAEQTVHFIKHGEFRRKLPPAERSR